MVAVNVRILFYVALSDVVVQVEMSLQPIEVTKEEFESVTFECLVEGTQQNSTWIRKSSHRRVGAGRLLQLHNLQQNDSDKYCCVVRVSKKFGVQHCATLNVGKCQT